MELEELKIYQLYMKMADDIWYIVYQWNYFEKDTIGKQLVRAADSIAANLSEGFSRFFYKEEKQFCYYSRNSLSETKTWLTKAFNRKLITQEQFESFSKEIKNIGVKLNNFIASIGKKNSSWEKIKLIKKNNFHGADGDNRMSTNDNKVTIE